MFTRMRICTTVEIREIDANAEQEYGLDTTLLMENAGRAATQIILERYPYVGISTEILIFAGKGNNAGDAFVVARRFLCLDRKVRVFHLQEESAYKGAALKNFQILKKLKARMIHLENSAHLQEFFNSSAGPFTLVDGILGTGLKANLEGKFYEIVEVMNQLHGSEVISLDIPTGVNGDTGAIHGTSIQANLTISFGFPKLGHFLPPGAGRRGDLINVDISLPPKSHKEGDKFLLMKSPMSALLKERDQYGHKNSFGHTLLIGGSPGRIGAIAMAARACHKMGTGLVTVASWMDSFEVLLIKLPNETMAVPLHLNGSEYEAYKANLPTYSSIVVGPGMGLRPDGKQLLQELLALYHGPMVIDADALNLIADHKLFEFLVNRRAPTILTPHPGEMARLLGIPKEEVSKDPVGAVRQAVSLTHSVVLLKGAATLIGSTEDVLYLNHYPNDGMATAGSGDVLAGMIGGLLGQKMDAFQGTLLGVYLHSLAGDFAAKAFGHRSMTAPDIIENIGNAIQDVKNAEHALPLDGRIRLL
jgi:ADP-dependent NAD(P)H-hydrate dehydratase / NAD(P)H-hydrate epimerase